MKIYNIELSNRIILGSSGYTSPKVFINCIKILRVEMVTVAIRRLNNNDNNFLDIIKKTKCHVLPNTAGCLSPKDAIVTAEMAREIFETNLIKLEVIEFKKDQQDTRIKHVFLNDKGKKIFYEIFQTQKKRIYNALLKSKSEEVVNFDSVLSRIINE